MENLTSMAVRVTSARRDSEIYHESEGLCAVPLHDDTMIDVERMREEEQHAYIRSTYLPQFNYVPNSAASAVDAIIRSCMCDQPLGHLTEVVIVDHADDRNATTITIDTRQTAEG